MNENLNKAVAHYANRLNAPKKMINVPEWNEKIYVKPATLHIRDQVYKIVTKDGGLSSLVDIIILRSLNSDDIPIYTSDDKPTFMNSIDPDVIIRVASEINSDLSGNANEDLVSIEKN
jgi:hypothetical protein